MDGRKESYSGTADVGGKLFWRRWFKASSVKFTNWGGGKKPLFRREGEFLTRRT